MYLNANLNILDKLGFPKARALDVLGQNEAKLKSSLERIDIDSFLDCINAAVVYTSDPNIALRLGHKFRVGTYGQTGNLYAYCKDLREVITLNNKYQKVAIDVGCAEYMEDSSSGHKMRFLPYYSDMETYRPITDIIMGSYVTAYRWLTWGSGEGIISTHFPYPRPNEISAYEEIFQSDLVFGSSNICLEFSDAAMSEHITTHDPERLTQVKIKLDKMLGQQMTIESFEQAVNIVIRSAIESGKISSPIVAERMGLSEPVFRSRLNATGEGIRPRIDQIRKSMFIEKYEAGQSFAQIAMALAYNDQPAMNRAFKRWFGTTPSKWQNEPLTPDF